MIPKLILQLIFEKVAYRLGGIEAANLRASIKWLDGRASFGIVPTFVLEGCVIELVEERVW